MKFLIIRFSSIGDIVLTTPVIRCLKKQVPSADVHFLTKRDFHSVLEHNPYIDKIHYFHGEWHSIIDELRNEHFDYVIDLHHNLRSLKIKRALKVPAFAVDKLNFKKWLYTAFKWNIMPAIHIVDRYLATIESFNVTNDGAGLDHFIPDGSKVQEEDIPTAHLAGFVAFVIGAAVNTKKFPIHKWQELCAIVDHPIILLGGKGDARQGDEIAETNPVKIYNSCGRFSLNESADLIRRAKLVVTNDTGLMHIAAAFKRPVISLWGNTVPEFGMYPYYGSNFTTAISQINGATAYDVMEIKHLSCRPCSKIGYRKCPKGHFKCMEQIDALTVSEKILARLRPQPGK